MKEFTANEAQRDFGRVLREAQGEPVRVVQGDVAGVVVSDEDFERHEALRRRVAWDRLAETMDRIGAHATAQGLTDEVLADILADEG